MAARRQAPAFVLATVACVVIAAVVVPVASPPLAAAGADGYDPNADVQTTMPAPPSTTPTPTTTAGAPRPVTSVLVVGDSVAWSLDAQLQRSPVDGVKVVDRGVIGCNIWRGEPVVIDGRRTSDPPACAQWPDRWRSLLSTVQPQVTMLVLGTSGNTRVLGGATVDECDPAFRAAFGAHAIEAIDVLSSTGAVVLVTTVPDLGVDFRPHARERLDCVNDALRAAVAARSTTAEIVDLAEQVCPGRACIQQRAGVVVRPDGLHFNAKGDPWVGRWLLGQALDPALLARHDLTR